MWDDFNEEDIQEEYLYGGQHKGDEEDNIALASQVRRSKESIGGESTSLAVKKDMRKFKCFVCHMCGNYASQCPKRKRRASLSR